MTLTPHLPDAPTKENVSTKRAPGGQNLPFKLPSEKKETFSAKRAMHQPVSSTFKASLVLLLTRTAFVFFLLLLIQTTATLAATDEQTILREAMKHFQLKDTGKSLLLFRQLAQMNPRKALYWFNLGNCYLLQENHSEAVQSYARVSSLKSPLSVAALIYQAKAYRNMGALKNSYRSLASVGPAKLPKNLKSEWIKERINLASAFLDKAMGVYKEQNDRDAFAYASRAIMLSSSAQAYQLRGLVLFRLNRFEQAKRDFHRARQLAKEPEEKEIDELIELTARGENDALSALLVAEAYAGTNSNVYAESESSLNAPITGLSASYWSRTYQWKRASSLWSIRLSGDEIIGLADERKIGTVAHARVAFESDALLITADPTLQYTLSGTDAQSLKAGIGLETEMSLGAHVLGLSWQLRRNLFYDPELAFMTGFSQLRRLYWRRRIANSQVVLSLANQVESSSDQILADEGLLPFSESSYGPIMSLEHEFGLWKMAFQSAYLYHFFSQPAEPGTERRIDRELKIAARVSWQFSTHFFGNAVLDFTKNDSTLGNSSIRDRNYSQLVAIGGLTWQLPL